jgi:dystonin
LKQKESQTSLEVTNQSSKYHELVVRANKLADRFSWIGNKTREYHEAMHLATKWLDETEPKVSHMAKELVAAEPQMVDKQLFKAKNLNNDIINNSKLINDVEQAAANLFNSLDGSQLSAQERNQIEQTSHELQKRYKEIADAMANLCADLDTALIQSQGVLDAMANLASWLDLAEKQLNSIKKPASLIPDRLDEQIRQLKLLEADVDSHETSIQKMFQVAQEFIKSGKNSQEAKKIDAKVTEIQNKYKTLVKTVSEQSNFFNEVSSQLNDFIQNVESFDEWYVQILEILETKEADGSETQLEEIAKQKDSKKPEFDQMIKNGKNLVGKKDITDANPCKETITELEEKWLELSNVLGEHESQNRARKQSLNVYEAMKEQITTWITKMEHKVNNFTPVPVELDLLKQQTDELKPINQEYKGFSKNMEKFREIALQYDSFLHQSQETILLSRRQSVSPRKPSMTPSGLGSHRLSTHSGKFPGSTARKESTIPSLYEQSPIQKHLTEVTSRYEMIGIRLGDREKALKSMQEDIKIFLENLKQIHQLLQKQEKAFSATLTTADKKESEKQILLIKNILDVLYSNQPLLDETKVGIKDILKKNSNAPGAEHLEKKLNDVVASWKSFQEQCKTRIEVLEELKEFYDVYENLNTWLMSKGKMMNVLGPIASDPRLVQNQLSQIAVMREDFNEKISQKERFVEVGNSLKKTASESGKNIDSKLKAIQSKWDELLGQLEDREKALNELSGPTRDFFNLTIKLQDSLSKISEDLDDIITSKIDVQQKIKTLEGISSNLNDQRPLWAQIESVGKQLQAILTDSVSKSEIKSKLTQVERQFNNCQKKLDNALAEFENMAKEGKEFDSDCQNILNMIGKFESLLSEKILVSANIETLKQQIQSFEPVYQDIMAKEHEIIMVLNKGKDILKHSSKNEGKTQQQLMDTIEKKWQKSKKTAQDYQKRLNTAMEYCKKFNNSSIKFEAWLDKAEAHLLTFTPLYFTKVDLQKQEKELQIFRNDVNRHSNEFDGTKANSVTLTDACDIDQEIVTEKITILQQRWDTLNASVNEKAVVIGNILAKLADFNDNVRDVTNSLSRLENKVSGIEKAPKDTKSLETLIGFLEETKDLENTFVTLHKQAESLLDDAEMHRSDASSVQSTVLNLRARMDSLQSRLEKQTNFLNTATTAVREFNEKTKLLHDTISKLYEDFNKMSHIGRDTETLQQQSDEIKEFILKVSQHQEQTSELSQLAEQLISQEYVSNKKEIKEVVSKLRKQLDELNIRAGKREKDVAHMVKTIQTFYSQLDITIESIQAIANDEKSFGPVGGDVEQIKSQQEKFRIFQKKSVENVAKSVEKINSEGQGLIQTAASGVNTSILEKDLEKMNEAWNSFKKSIADREKRLDQCLIQSGKFQDALKGINSWFEEMDDMISNQKPPSSDYKVVKAQVQEQKFVVKLLADRKNGIDALVKIGREIAASATEKEKQGIEDQIHHVEKHFTELSQKCNGRMVLLEKTLPLAKDYQDKLTPIEKWLEQTERKMKVMEVVPTDESQIQKSIKELEVLQKEISGKELSFKDLESVAKTLMQLVGDEDANGLKDTADDLNIRYNALLKKSDDTNKLLQSAKASLRSLVLAYEELLDWMEKTESKLLKFRVLSVFTETLLEQMENIHSVTEDIVAHQKNIEDVIALGNNLMKYINNEEALQLKDKIDSLQRKYNDLATKAADLLKNAQEMMPLVQSFHQSHNRLYEWLSGVEEILQSLDSNNLEDQEIEIKRLEEEVIENRPLLENINSSGPKLSQVSPGEGAKTIEDLVARDNRRFDNVCEQIKKKSERIQSSKQRSLEIVADINELLDWFREVEGQLKEAHAPSSEPDLIRIQLKEHKTINDEVSSQKGRVKDVLSNAKKVLREIAQTSETEQVKEKMEDLKETMEIVIKLSIDRLSILEQALPLSEHFYETHNEFTQWLDGIEHDAMNQLLPGMRPDLIAKQQEINRSFMQSVQDHKAVLDRLNKTGGALLRLIVGDDSYRIQEIIENDNQRYNALKAGLREMQQALDQSMQECAQFTDQLDGMLNALATTSDNLNNAEPISAHPEKIKEQMEDNNAIIYDIDNKEEAFDAVRKAAADVIDKATNKNDPAIKDMKKKLDKLNHLWNQIKNATKDRSESLKDALTLAENFWSALQQVLSSIKTIENSLVSQEPPAVEPKAIEAQKAELKNIMKGIESTKPGVDGCLKTGKELLTIVGEPEKPELKQHIEELSDAWENITALYAKRESNLLDAMEKAMEFHENRQNLLDFLSTYEKKFNSLEAVTSDIEAIKKQIDELKAFKNEVDPWMVNVETLNR